MSDLICPNDFSVPTVFRTHAVSVEKAGRSLLLCQSIIVHDDDSSQIVKFLPRKSFLKYVENVNLNSLTQTSIQT